jgi:hypothetical protein
MAMNAARVIALLLIAGLLTSPTDLSSCGPFLLTAVFTLSRQPDQPDTSFAQGQLGILLPSYYRAYLAVAYRHLTGVGVNASERAAFFPAAPPPGPAPEWNREWNTSVPPPVQEWLEARKRVPGAPAPLKIDVYHRETTPTSYSEYLNCPDDAFHSAVLTLQARQAKFTAAEMQDWLRGQDEVFANCSGGPVTPKPAPDGTNNLLRADRAYQIAAANFYARNFEQAESQFRTIAADQNSPWRAMSAYLLARCQIRRATLADQPASMAEAESELQAIAKDDALKAVQPAAAGLLQFVRARLHPEQRLHELSQSILAKNAGPTLAQDFTDYLFLFYKRDGSLKPPDDLTDWLETFRANTTLTDRVIQRWRETQSLPWLVAALTQAHASDTSTPQLLQAADKIQPDSPAYATVVFHAIRLLEESKQSADARKRLDTILASRSKYPASAVNLFLAERMRESESWEAFLKHAPRAPVGSGYDYDGESPSNLTSDPQLKPFAGRPIFDADASTILNEQVPLGLLKDAATSGSLPATLRGGIATAAWVRAVLLDNDALARELAPLVQTLVPELKQPLTAYMGAADKDARKFEAVYLMLKNPGLRPFIETGFGRLTPIAKIDDLRDNWWCSLSPQVENYQANYYRSRAQFSTPLAMLYGNGKSEAGFLAQPDRTQADTEWKALAAIPAAPTFLPEQAVNYLKTHSADPRAPEALALAVRSTRYGCGDAGTSKQSQAAFHLLHSRYPNSESAKKTKYYY